MADRLAESKGGMDALDSLLNVIAFNSIKDAIDEGTTEFTFSVDDMGDDEKGRDIFYHIVRRVPMLNVIKEGKKKKDKEEQK